MALPEIELEIVSSALARAGAFIRSMAVCPNHGWITAYVFTPEGPTEWRTPVCEAIDDDTCEFRAAREEIVEEIVDAIGERFVGSSYEFDRMEDCDHEEYDDLGWWSIGGTELLEALRRVGAGADPDMVYQELYAESDTEEG